MVYLLAESHYKPLDRILEEVNLKSVKLNPQHKRLCRQKAFIVSSLIISSMKKTDEVFRELFSRLDFIGSFYDGLKVREATSFNMNLIMKLPLNYQFIECETEDVLPYVKLYVDNSLKSISNERVSRVLNSWICDGYLLEDKPRNWLESVLARTFHSNSEQMLSVLNNSYLVHFKKNGPSYTIHVHGDPEIDLIFAFTIEFSYDKCRPPLFKKHEEYPYPWCVVSDTVKKNVYGRSSNQWRISFPGTERRIIYNKQKLKYILRLLKAFRDSQTNIVIPSYFFTNLFMWEAYQINEGIKEPWFWQKGTGYLFVYMLFKLYDELRRGLLEYYWNENINLLANHNNDHIINMSGQLKNIIFKINSFIENRDERSLKAYIYKLYSVSEFESTSFFTL